MARTLLSRKTIQVTQHSSPVNQLWELYDYGTHHCMYSLGKNAGVGDIRENVRVGTSVYIRKMWLNLKNS